MVTHDSRKNEHCAVEKKKAEAIPKLLENWLKTNYYHCFCCKNFLHGNGRRQRILFTRAYISLKSNPRAWSRSQQLEREAKGAKAKLFLYLQGQRRRQVKTMVTVNSRELLSILN